jgi:hypothetical protein
MSRLATNAGNPPGDHTMFHNAFQWHNQNGAPVRHGNITVTPQAQVLSLQLPLGKGRAAFVWNRPVAVLVEENGHTRRLPIVDVTRLAQVALLVASALVMFFGRRRASAHMPRIRIKK